MQRTLGVVLGVLVLTACSGQQDPGLQPQQRPSELEASDGMRFAGLGQVALEVPDNWESVVAGSRCGRVPDGTVYFRLEGRRAPCEEKLPTTRSWVVLEPIDRDDSLLLAMRRGGLVDGAQVRRTGIACLDSSPAVCSASIAVAGERFLAQVHVRSRTAEAEVAAMLDSLRVVDDGVVAVPPIRYGTSDEDALAELEELGLEGRVPEVDWPHYVTGSEPPPGTVVEVGSVIGLTIGDG